MGLVYLPTLSYICLPFMINLLWIYQSHGSYGICPLEVFDFMCLLQDTDQFRENSNKIVGVATWTSSDITAWYQKKSGFEWMAMVKYRKNLELLRVCLDTWICSWCPKHVVKQAFCNDIDLESESNPTETSPCLFMDISRARHTIMSL